MYKFLFTLFTLIPILSHAEAKPDMMARMEILDSTSDYRYVQAASILRIANRGAVESFAVNLDSRSPIYFAVTDVKRTKCGDIYKGISRDLTMDSRTSALTLTDMSHATCERVVTHLWENVVLETRDFSGGRISRIKMQGNPTRIDPL